MGAAAIFSSADADFSGICDGMNGLSVSDIIQKAYIEVDEQGTTLGLQLGIRIFHYF